MQLYCPLQEEVADNETEAQRYRDDIAANEAARKEIQGKIESAIDGNSSANFLKILSTFRIQVGHVFALVASKLALSSSVQM